MPGGTTTVRLSNRHEPAPSTMAAVVVASSEVVRRGLAGLLRSVPEVGSVRTLSHLEELPLLRHPERIALVIVAADDAATLAGFQSMLAQSGTRVLVVVDAASAGDLASHPVPAASGFLWQHSLNSASLRDAIRRCHRGEIPVPPELARALLMRGSDTVPRPRPSQVNLTSREREVLSLLVKGFSNKQIAKHLSISSHGAKRLVTSIMLKLNTPNRTLAAVTAIRCGYVVDQ